MRCLSGATAVVSARISCVVGCSWAAAAAMEDKLHNLRAGPCEPSLGCMGLATPIPIPSAACAAPCWGLWPAVAWFTPASSPPYESGAVFVSRVFVLSFYCVFGA